MLVLGVRVWSGVAGMGSAPGLAPPVPARCEGPLGLLPALAGSVALWSPAASPLGGVVGLGLGVVAVGSPAQGLDSSPSLLSDRLDLLLSLAALLAVVLGGLVLLPLLPLPLPLPPVPFLLVGPRPVRSWPGWRGWLLVDSAACPLAYLLLPLLSVWEGSRVWVS